MINWKKLLANKYFVCSALFVLWLLFFDEQDVFYVLRQKHKVAELQKKKAQISEELALLKTQMTDLENNPKALEKYAREYYLMKKENETIFLIETDSNLLEKK